MIEFNKDLLTFKYISVLKVSTHGIITHMDENEEVKKLKCPPFIVQQFKKKAHKSNFRFGKKSCILFYDNYPIAIDTPTALFFNLKDKADFLENWTSKFERGIEQIKEKLETDEFKNNKAFIDGKFLFMLEEDKEAKEDEPAYKNLTQASDDGFYTASCKAFNLKNLSSDSFALTKRTAIIYHIKNNDTNEYVTAVSPTISGIKYKDIDTKEVNFDKMDKCFYVNLNFILNSTKTVGESYGFEAISFLDLEEVLIKMNTVNLFSFPDYIRNITPIKQSFKECLSWIIGLSYREKNLEYLIEYRTILAGLLEKFIIKRDYVDNTLKENIFNETVPAISMDDLNKKYKYLGELDRAKILEKEEVGTQFLI
jgi:hypothetical protein